jgi:UDP-N-acetylmuramoyl-tripeptide--D-alanyl-D-alanine ligase
MKLNLAQIIEATGGHLINAPSFKSKASEIHLNGVGTDTRQNLKNLLFMALKGDAYDAHHFLDQAVAQGAACLVVHSFDPKFNHLLEQVPVIQVANTLIGLQALAQFWRRQLKTKILGITGTNGKTTTKEFTAALLTTQFKTQYSKGSLNNHWGVPLSLLSIEAEHEVAVIEMGMNHPGEIKTLVTMAEPDVVVVTMVGRGHLEGLGTIEAVAQAKSEIYEFSPAAHGAQTQFIFNLENPHTHKMFNKYGTLSTKPPLIFASSQAESAQTQVLDVTFKIESADAEAIEISGQIQGLRGRVRVPVFGAHNVTNLMAASCLALSCGMKPEKIWQELPQCRSGWGRNQWVKTESGARVLFDAYNANPESMRAAIENFSTLQATQGGRKLGVFGEMREMGAAAAVVHRELGCVAGLAGFGEIIFIGPSAAEFGLGLRDAKFQKNPLVSISCEDFLASGALPVLNANDIVLMKGSRGMALERLLKEWKPIDFSLK